MLAFFASPVFANNEVSCVASQPGDCPEVYGDVPADYTTEELCGDAAYFKGTARTCPYGNDMFDLTKCAKQGIPYRYNNINDGLFNITQIEGTTRRGTNDKGINSFEYFGKARINYTIKCQNGITYQDSYEWEQYSHNCARVAGHSCSDAQNHLNQFEAVSLDSYNPVTKYLSPQIASGWGGMSPMVLPEWEIIKKWENRKVGIPKYLGGTHKLAVPLVLINGIGLDYTSWGVTPAGEAGSDAWLSGEVSDYNNGSLPDVVSRAYGLAKEGDINNNGMYFINLDYTQKDAEPDMETMIKRLQERFEKISMQHVTFDEKYVPQFKMDLVCHSSSCLLLNEALRRFSTQKLMGYTVNLNDYIRNIIAVDAPHYGTALAKSRTVLERIESENPEVGGLASLHRELDGEANEDLSLHASIELDYSTLGAEKCEGLFTPICWSLGQLTDIGAWVADFWGNDVSEYTLNVYGGLWGPHRFRLDMGSGNKVFEGTDQSLQGYQENIKTKRSEAIYWQNTILSQMGTNHPRRSDGSFVPYSPFYGADVTGLENIAIEYISSQSLGVICDGVEDMRCGDFKMFLESSLESKLEEYLGGGLEDRNIHLGTELSDMVDRLRTGWFAHSDLVVEKSSQVWDLQNKVLSQNSEIANSTELKEPKTYSIHQASLPKGHPEYAALHAPFTLPFAFGKPSLQMGKDLFCALEADCDQLSRMGSNPLYAGKAIAYQFQGPTEAEKQEALGQPIELAGDFTLYPINQSGELGGFLLKDPDGKTVGQVVYDPTHGTYVLTTDITGIEETVSVPSSALPKQATSGSTLHSVTLLPPEQRPQFVVSRVGNALSVVVVGQMGYRKTVSLGTYTKNSLVLVSLSDMNSTEPVTLIGKATPVITQEPLPEYGKIKVVLQEKGEHEANQSRPWMWVTNSSTAAVKNLTLTYYYTADPARAPKPEMDYPTTVQFEQVHLGGDHYKLVVQVPELPAQGVFPGQSGLQIRLHYNDWTHWMTSDDYSAGSLMPLPAKKVVVRDAQDRIVWGEEPSPEWFETQTLSQTEPVHLELSIADAGPNESNILRPKVFVKHLGGPALEAGFKVVCFWSGLGRLGTKPKLKEWYSPESDGQLTRLADGRVKMEWSFDAYNLYQGQQVSIGDFGVYWDDWTALDKTGFAKAQWVVLDAKGQVVLGEWPSDATSGQTAEPVQPISLDVTLADNGSHEQNQIRPAIRIAHKGGAVLLAGYKIRMEFDLPGPYLVQPKLKGWYSAYVDGSLTRDANGRVHVEWNVPNYDLFSGQELSFGDWGIYWDNWQNVDKSGFASAQVTILDKNGNEVARYGY